MFKMDDNFRNWLNKNKFGTYNGFEIKKDTELVAYTYVISIFVVTFTQSTRYYFKEAEANKAKMAKILSTLCCILFGWWGIPWGPIKTIQAISGNFSDQHTLVWSSGVVTDGASVAELNITKAKAPKKIKTKDLIIYILIGLVVGIALIYAAVNGII